jgi:hypothetical protein
MLKNAGLNVEANKSQDIIIGVLEWRALND